MEQLQRIYISWISNAPAVLVVSGILLIGGMLASGLQVQAPEAEELQILILRGNFVYALFLAFILILVYIGWRFDNQPGRTIVVALIAAFVGSIINMLFPLALSGGWFPVWIGLMTGIFMVTLYAAWQIRARFALVTISMIIYTMLVTSGFVLAIEHRLSTPIILGIVTIGGIAFCLACVVCDRILTNIKTARRGAVDQHINDGVLLSIRTVILWASIAILITLPAAVMGTGPFRSLGLLFLIGVLASVYAILAFPAPLALATSGLSISQESERSDRRESRRRR